MTNRDLGEVGIKLIGVYFAASGVVGFTFVIAALVQGPLEGFLDAGFLLFLNVLPLAGRLGVGAICLFWGGPLAARVFEDTGQRLTAVSRHDLLIVGLALLGAGLAVGALPGLLRFAVQAIWYAEGSRQAQFLPSMSRQWQGLADNMLAFLVGATLAAKAGGLAAIVDRRRHTSSNAPERPV